jgi:hypothetical protein
MKKKIAVGVIVILIIVVSVLLIIYYTKRISGVQESELPLEATIPSFVMLESTTNPGINMETVDVPASSIVQQRLEVPSVKEKHNRKIFIYDPILKTYMKFTDEDVNCQEDDNELDLYIKINGVVYSIVIKKTNKNIYKMGTTDVGVVSFGSTTKPLDKVETKGNNGLVIKFNTKLSETDTNYIDVELYINKSNDLESKKVGLYVVN